MRRIQAQQTAPRPYLQQNTQSVIVPSPTSGWNAIDPLALMDPKFAPILDNWIPRTGFVEVRPGYSAWAQNLVASTPVESLMTYRPAVTEKLFAACGSQIFDVTLQGIAVSVQSGLQNARWQYVNFTPALGLNYLYIVNGQDAPRYWDGTAWTQPTITGSTHSPTSFNNIAVWKRRIWFVEGNSTIACYLGTDAITGAVGGELDIGALLTKGGHLVSISSLTVDGGNGPDDLLILLSSRGEAVCYKGTDPTNANAFSLVGVFPIPPPLGSRCTMDYGAQVADLAIITLEGVIPLTQALPLGSTKATGVALTRNIQDAMRQSAKMGESNFGWEMIEYPAEGVFILNVPLATDSNQLQYVMNAITGAWCRFVGWNANTFAVFNDQLFFGDDNGNVNLAWSGGADLVSPIVSDMQCAFNYFGDPGKVKQVQMVQPLLNTSGALTPTIGVDVDFGSKSPTALVSTAANTGSVYGTAIYGTSTYSAGVSTQALWQGTQASGHALAIRMKVNLAPSGAGSNSVFNTGTFDSMVFDGFGTGTSTLQVMGFNAVVTYGGVI